MSTLAPAKSGQMSLRITPTAKQIIEQAAIIAGQTVTDFVIAISTEKARQVVEQHRVIRLSQAAFDEFSAVLDSPETLPITPLASQLIGEYARSTQKDGTLDW